MFPLALRGFFIALVGEHAVHEIGQPVAHIAFHNVSRQGRQAHMGAGGVGGGGQVGHRIAERAVQIKGNGLYMFDSGSSHDEWA